jgi:hypothetical protein
VAPAICFLIASRNPNSDSAEAGIKEDAQQFSVLENCWDMPANNYQFLAEWQVDAPLELIYEILKEG